MLREIKHYHTNGKLYYHCFVNKNDATCYVHTSYYDNGNMESIGFYNDVWPQGFQIYYLKSGNIKDIYNCKNILIKNGIQINFEY